MELTELKLPFVIGTLCSIYNESVIFSLTFSDILQQEESFFFFLVSNEAMSVGGSTLQMHFVWPVRDGSSFSVA